MQKTQTSSDCNRAGTSMPTHYLMWSLLCSHTVICLFFKKCLNYLFYTEKKKEHTQLIESFKNIKTMRFIPPKKYKKNLFHPLPLVLHTASHALKKKKAYVYLDILTGCMSHWEHKPDREVLCDLQWSWRIRGMAVASSPSIVLFPVPWQVEEEEYGIMQPFPTPMLEDCMN